MGTKLHTQRRVPIVAPATSPAQDSGSLLLPDSHGANTLAYDNQDETSFREEIQHEQPIAIKRCCKCTRAFACDSRDSSRVTGHTCSLPNNVIPGVILKSIARNMRCCRLLAIAPYSGGSSSSSSRKMLHYTAVPPETSQPWLRRLSLCLGPCIVPDQWWTASCQSKTKASTQVTFLSFSHGAQERRASWPCTEPRTARNSRA